MSHWAAWTSQGLQPDAVRVVHHEISAEGRTFWPLGGYSKGEAKEMHGGMLGGFQPASREDSVPHTKQMHTLGFLLSVLETVLSPWCDIRSMHLIIQFQEGVKKSHMKIHMPDQNLAGNK